jgi:hypothetical protein
MHDSVSVVRVIPRRRPVGPIVSGRAEVWIDFFIFSPKFIFN